MQRLRKSVGRTDAASQWLSYTWLQVATCAGICDLSYTKIKIFLIYTSHMVTYHVDFFFCTQCGT